MSLSNDASKSSLTPCPARLTPSGSGALRESAVACLWSDQRAGVQSGPLKFTPHAVGAGAPRGRSAGPSGSLSLGWGSRCQLHASNFRLNPGSLPGPREPCSSALGADGSPLVCVCSSCCRLIRLGPRRTLSSPQRRRRWGNASCLFLQDALGCPGVLAGVCACACF